MVVGDDELAKADIPEYLHPYYDVMKDAVIKMAEEEASKPKRVRRKLA